MSKKKELTGFLNGLNFAARILDVVQVEMIKKIKDERQYQKMGYEKWPDFCKEVFDRSDEWVNQRIKVLEELGAGLTATLLKSNLDWKDIRLIPHMLDEEQKKQIKKDGFIEVDGKKIPINADNEDTVITAVKLLKERVATAQKETERTTSKLRGLDREIKEREKKISELEASLKPTEEKNRHWAENHLKEIESLYKKIDFAFRSIAFNERIWEDLQLQGMIVGMCDSVDSLLRAFRQDFNAARNERYGE